MRVALLANIPRVQAQRLFEKIKNREVELHHDTVYECVLEATGSQTVAESYRNAIIKSHWKPPTER